MATVRINNDEPVWMRYSIVVDVPDEQARTMSDDELRDVAMEIVHGESESEGDWHVDGEGEVLSSMSDTIDQTYEVEEIER